MPRMLSATSRLSNPLRKTICKRVILNQQLRGYKTEIEPEFADTNDFIMSILQANPSSRDAQFYLNMFANPSLRPSPKSSTKPPPDVRTAQSKLTDIAATTVAEQTARQQAVIENILNPTQRRTALVKIQGPFTDRQLESICRGLVYLEKLGLVSVIVAERDDWRPGENEEDRLHAKEDVLRVTSFLEQQGARARPILEPVVRLGPKPEEREKTDGSASRLRREEHLLEYENGNELSPHEWVPDEDVHAHTLPEDLTGIRSALRVGEIPVLTPLALDSFGRMIRIHANDVVGGLVRGMVEAGKNPEPKFSPRSKNQETNESNEHEVDMTPLRLMIINREGGVPSYARTGLPHLLINLSSEHQHIHSTYQPEWHQSHPTSLQNLDLASKCLSDMPASSSAIIVSHRSPRSLIANLITNKPAQSSSLPDHLLVSGPKKLTPHTPTLIRKGLPIRIIQRSKMDEMDKDKMTHLLEKSFKRKLQADEFYSRLERDLGYIIVAGDYAGAAIVTNEPIPNPSHPSRTSLCYLDKFAVHPDHQGDGTVDFLWVALHDESYGLGLTHALNPNEGGHMGVGRGKDLVWRSRSDNPANKWYFERSSGHLKLPPSTPGGQSWTMFWCDAEDRLKERESELIRDGWQHAQRREGRKGRVIDGPSFVEDVERGRLSDWAEVVEKIPSSWKPLEKPTATSS
ncbi:Amino-acid acetyltransferase, mitochondrial [Tulasnella sp. 419]|nr:Amino-acid acetyltransferase, mitochondrial [Tulasnella sp. 419]